jgi:hypothetical protein
VLHVSVEIHAENGKVSGAVYKANDPTLVSLVTKVRIITGILLIRWHILMALDPVSSWEGFGLQFSCGCFSADEINNYTFFIKCIGGASLLKKLKNSFFTFLLILPVEFGRVFPYM